MTKIRGRALRVDVRFGLFLLPSIVVSLLDQPTIVSADLVRAGIEVD